MRSISLRCIRMLLSRWRWLQTPFRWAWLVLCLAPRCLEDLQGECLPGLALFEECLPGLIRQALSHGVFELIPAETGPTEQCWPGCRWPSPRALLVKQHAAKLDRQGIPQTLFKDGLTVGL